MMTRIAHAMCRYTRFGESLFDVDISLLEINSLYFNILLNAVFANAIRKLGDSLGAFNIRRDFVL